MSKYSAEELYMDCYKFSLESMSNYPDEDTFNTLDHISDENSKYLLTLLGQTVLGSIFTPSLWRDSDSKILRFDIVRYVDRTILKESILSGIGNSISVFTISDEHVSLDALYENAFICISGIVGKPKSVIISR